MPGQRRPQDQIQRLVVQALEARRHFDQTGDLRALDQAISVFQVLLADAGAARLVRFRATGESGDLVAAVTLYEQVNGEAEALGNLEPVFPRNLAGALAERVTTTYADRALDPEASR